MAPLRVLLSDSGFRRLYATRLAGQTCDGIFQASLAGFVLFSPERATTASSLAAAAAVLLLPYSVVGPIAGVVIDRVPRARILVVANLIRSVIVVGVALIILAGNAGVPFYGAALLAFAVNRFILSALSASLPGVTPADQLVTGNSLSTTSGTLATVVGAGIGAGIAAIVSGAGAGHDHGQAAAAFAGAVGYALSAVVAVRLPGRRLGPHDRPTDRATEAVAQAFRDLVAGAVYLWRRRIARDALAAQTSHRFFYGLWTVTAVLLERNLFEHRGGIFHGGAAGLGELVVATGAGSVTAALVTPWIARRIGTQTWIVIALMCGGVGLVALGLPVSAWCPGRGRVGARLRRAGNQGLHRHDRPAQHRRRLSGPGVRVLRPAVQYRLRRGGRGRCSPRCPRRDARSPSRASPDSGTPSPPSPTPSRARG